MIFIEFDCNFNNNIIKYKNIDDDNWYYLYINIETLNLLINNFGIIYTNCDNPSTSRTIDLKYCGADIKMICNNKTPFYIPLIEQNY